MCLCSVSVFRRRIILKLLTPKFTKGSEKSVFEEKEPLKVKKIKISLAMIYRHRHMDSHIPAKFCGNR